MLTVRVAFSRLRRAARRFIAGAQRQRRHHFRASLIPILGFAGAAVDYSRANSVKADMQAALDSAALMVSKNAATMSAAQIQTATQNAFLAAVHAAGRQQRPGHSELFEHRRLHRRGQRLGRHGHRFHRHPRLQDHHRHRLVDVQMGLDAAARGAGARQYRIDGTDGKITALKTATTNLLTPVAERRHQRRRRLCVDRSVQQGRQRRQHQHCGGLDRLDGLGREQRQQCEDVHRQRHQQTCTTNWVPKAHSAWNGCVTDRGGSNGPSSANYDQNVTAPIIGKTNSLFPAEQYSSCALAMTGLSYNWASMTSLVNQMTPNGSTNQPIGLVWGWQSLVGGGPFTVPAEDPNYHVSEDHHPAVGRPQHAGPLVRQRLQHQHPGRQPDV